MTFVARYFPMPGHFNAERAARAVEAAAQQGARPRHGPVEADYDDPATLDRITKDVEDGQALGVQGTPTFFVNGEQLQPRSSEPTRPRRSGFPTPSSASQRSLPSRPPEPRSSPEHTLRRWYWLGLQTGATPGLAFVGWLIFQSLYRISALCPYCMVVWAVVMPTFWYVTLTNLTPGPPRRITARQRRHTVDGAQPRRHLTVAYLAVVALITHRFWDYWSTLVG